MSKELPDNERCRFHSRAWGCRCDKPIGHDGDCVSMGDGFAGGWDPAQGTPGGPVDQAERARLEKADVGCAMAEASRKQNGGT